MIIIKLTHFCSEIQQIHVINSYRENLASEMTSVNTTDRTQEYRISQRQK